MFNRILTVEEGIAVVSRFAGTRFAHSYDLMSMQLSAILAYDFQDADVTISVLRKAFTRLGIWMRGVNEIGKFNLPLKSFEKALYKEIKATTKFNLFPLWGLINGEVKGQGSVTTEETITAAGVSTETESVVSIPVMPAVADGDVIRVHMTKEASKPIQVNSSSVARLRPIRHIRNIKRRHLHGHVPAAAHIKQPGYQTLGLTGNC